MSIDLRLEAVKSHWAQQGPMLSSAIEKMEAAETWPIDDRETIRQALERLAQQIDEACVANAPPDDVLMVLAFIRSGRAIALLEWATKTQTALTATLTARAIEVLANATEGIHVEGSKLLPDAAKIFLDRLVCLKNSAVLARVFTPERAAALEAAINVAKQAQQYA